MHGLRCLILFFLFFSAESQHLELSRIFETSRRVIPVQFLNPQGDYFYVLRYNKIINDFIVEKRNKGNAELAGSTALRLPDHNSPGFNFEKLDYVFFKTGPSVFFIYNRILNTEQELRLVSIDTAGRLSQEIVLERIASTEGAMLEIKFAINSHQHLVIESTHYFEKLRKLSVKVYDPLTNSFLSTRRLPPESGALGLSLAIAADHEGGIYYLQGKQFINRWERKYNSANQIQMMIPKFSYTGIKLKAWPAGVDSIRSFNIDLPELSVFNGADLNIDNGRLTLALHATMDIKGKEEVAFYATAIDLGFNSVYYSRISFLDSATHKKLEYYDGTDYKQASKKEFELIRSFNAGGGRGYVSGRQDESYSKELFFWILDTSNGIVGRQWLVPRKVFFFPHRSVFKGLAEPLYLVEGKRINVFVAEHPSNISLQYEQFRYGKFKKQRSIGGNLVRYELEDGNVRKTLIYESGEFDFVPVKMSKDSKAPVIYLNSGKGERFGFLEQ